MKKLFLGALLCLSLSPALRAETCVNGNRWEHIYGLIALDFAAGADGSLWHVGVGASPGGFGTWFLAKDGTWASGGGGVMTIAAGPDGKAWATNESYEIFFYEANDWKRFPGYAQRIAVGPKGHLWSIGFAEVAGGHEVREWNGKEWKGVGRGAKRLAVTPAGEPVIVTNANEVFRSESGVWKSLPGSLNAVAVGPVGEMWGISTTPSQGGFEIVQWRESSKKWIPMNGGGNMLAVGANGVPYTAKLGGASYRGVKCE